MVKSKSAGYICPSHKERKDHRFSLAEESLSDEAANSLLPAAADFEYNRGKYQVLSKLKNNVRGAWLNLKRGMNKM